MRLVPRVADSLTASVSALPAGRLRRRLPAYLAGVAAAALLTRALAAVLPMELAAAWAVVVAIGIPGWAALRLAGLDRRLGAAEAVAVVPVAALTVWAVPLALGMLTGVPFLAVEVVVLAAAACGLAACEPFDRRLVDVREAAGLAAAALVAGAVGWYYQGGPGAGDALFHAGRVRKLLELDGLSLSGVSTYLNGAPHAGYAFPLLHAAQAGAVKLAGGDPGSTYLSLAPIFVAMVPLAVYGAGRAIGGAPVGAAAALLACWDALVPGEWPFSLQWSEQPPTYTFVVLLPLAVLIAHELRRTPDDRALQGASVAVVVVVAFVHPTYVFPLLAVTTGLALLTRSGLRVLLATYAAGAAVLGWIWWEALAGAPRAEAFHPVYRSGISRVFHHTAMLSGTSILHHRAPFLLAMIAMPVLLVAFGRRWTLAAATMLGPFVLVALPGALALLVPIVNLAQARRFWIAVPWEFVAAIALALIAARLRGRWLAVAAVAAVALSYLTRLRQPWLWTDNATSLTVLAAVVSLALALWLIARGRLVRPAAPLTAGTLPTLLLAACILAVPALAHDYHRKPGSGKPGVSPGVIGFLRAHESAPFPVVLADLDPAYTMSGEAAVYVVAVNEGHMRAEPKNQPVERRAAVARFMDPATAEPDRDAILDRWHVRYVVVQSDSPVLPALAGDPRLAQVYADPDTVPVPRTIFEVHNSPS